jgi:hypothetical protein
LLQTDTASKNETGREVGGSNPNPNAEGPPKAATELQPKFALHALCFHVVLATLASNTIRKTTHELRWKIASIFRTLNHIRDSVP